MITVLTGENWFGIHTELTRLVSSFVAEHTDMALERFDGDEGEYDQMRAAVESLPFLTARKLVVLRDPSKLKAFAEHIDEFLASISDTTDVIIVETKIDKRLAYYKTLKKQTNFVNHAQLDPNGLMRWAQDYAKQSNAMLSAKEARYLVDAVGPNQQLLSHEIDKLALYSAEITKHAIDVLVDATPQSTIFELIEASFSGNTGRAYELYNEQRLLKVEPQQIIALLAWQLHILSVVKTAGQRSPDVIATESRLSPFVVKKSKGIASKLTLKALKEHVFRLAELDMRLKRESIDADEALQTYLLQLGH